MPKYCTKCGKQLEEGKTCGCNTASKKEKEGERKANPYKTVSSIGIIARNWLGLNESNMNETEDPFERGKMISPDIISPCDEEIPIKQYHIANFRSRLQGMWAEGRLEITNKRVIFRASGRSFIGKTIFQEEFKIDQILGMQISKGVRFDMLTFLITFILAFPAVMALSWMLFADNFLKYIVGTIAVIPFFISIEPYWPRRKNHFAKSLLCAMSACLFYAGALESSVSSLYNRSSGGGAAALYIFAFVAFILALFSLFAASLKPSVTLYIQAEGGDETPINFFSPQHFKLQQAKEILPASETDIAIKEVGALILDVQQLGDTVLDKWTTGK